jgi:hypothetical protein
MILYILSQDQNFVLNLNEKSPVLNLQLDLAYSYTDYEHYEGSYTVAPKITSQVMKTKDKIMDDDVNIKEIYVNKTENSYGYTVQIGEI